MRKYTECILASFKVPVCDLYALVVDDAAGHQPGQSARGPRPAVVVDSHPEAP